MTAVLLECFFIDNAADKNIGDTRAEQRALGVAYAKAILEYMGIAHKGNTPAKPATSEPSKKLYRVQAGAYADYANAEKIRDKVIAAGFAAFISEE